MSKVPSIQRLLILFQLVNLVLSNNPIARRTNFSPSNSYNVPDYSISDVRSTSRILPLGSDYGDLVEGESTVPIIRAGNGNRRHYRKQQYPSYTSNYKSHRKPSFHRPSYGLTTVSFRLPKLLRLPRIRLPSKHAPRPRKILKVFRKLTPTYKLPKWKPSYKHNYHNYGHNNNHGNKGYGTTNYYHDEYKGSSYDDHHHAECKSYEHTKHHDVYKRSEQNIHHDEYNYSIEHSPPVYFFDSSHHGHTGSDPMNKRNNSDARYERQSEIDETPSTGRIDRKDKTTPTIINHIQVFPSTSTDNKQGHSYNDLTGVKPNNKFYSAPQRRDNHRQSLEHVNNHQQSVERFNNHQPVLENFNNLQPYIDYNDENEYFHQTPMVDYEIIETGKRIDYELMGPSGDILKKRLHERLLKHLLQSKGITPNAARLEQLQDPKNIKIDEPDTEVAIMPKRKSDIRKRIEKSFVLASLKRLLSPFVPAERSSNKNIKRKEMSNINKTRLSKLVRSFDDETFKNFTKSILQNRIMQRNGYKLKNENNSNVNKDGINKDKMMSRSDDDYNYFNLSDYEVESEQPHGDILANSDITLGGGGVQVQPV